MPLSPYGAGPGGGGGGLSNTQVRAIAESVVVDSVSPVYQHQAGLLSPNVTIDSTSSQWTHQFTVNPNLRARTLVGIFTLKYSHGGTGNAASMTIRKDTGSTSTVNVAITDSEVTYEFRFVVQPNTTLFTINVDHTGGGEIDLIDWDLLLTHAEDSDDVLVESDRFDNNLASLSGLIPLDRVLDEIDDFSIGNPAQAQLTAPQQTLLNNLPFWYFTNTSPLTVMDNNSPASSSAIGTPDAKVQGYPVLILVRIAVEIIGGTDTTATMNLTIAGNTQAIDVTRTSVEHDFLFTSSSLGNTSLRAAYSLTSTFGSAAEDIRINSLNGVVLPSPAAGLTETEARNLISGWARTGNTTDIPDDKIPAEIARDSEIDGHIAAWARASSPSGTIPENRVPASIARDSEIAPYARATPSGTVPAAQISNEVIQDIVGAMVSDNTETGISVSYDDGTGKLNFVVTVSGGGQPAVQAHNIWVASSTTQTFTAATFTGTDGATVATGNDVRMPAYSGNRYFAVAIPSTKELVSVTAPNFLGNLVQGMTKQSGTLTINSETVEWWVSINAVRIGNTTLTITTRDD